MKKCLKIAALSLLFAVILLGLGGNMTAYADDGSAEAVDKLFENIDELLSATDFSELEQYLQSVAGMEGIDLIEKIKDFLQGDYQLDYSSLFSFGVDLLWSEGKALVPVFVIILAAVLVCGLLKTLKSEFLHSSMSDIISYVSFICVGSAVLACLISVLKVGFSSLKEMQKQMEIVYPILLTLMAGSGGAVSVGVYRPAVAFFSGGIVELFLSFVLPVTVLMIVLSFVGHLSDAVPVRKLSGFFGSLTRWTIGLALGLFTIFLTVQGITSAQFDGISLRAAKYAIGTSVPIVGGFLSGGVDLILAGSALIKNAVGSFAVFMLAASMVKPLISVVAFQLFLKFAAAVTEPADGKLSSFMGDLSSNLGYLSASILLIAFLYFITLLLLICSSGVIF